MIIFLNGLSFTGLSHRKYKFYLVYGSDASQFYSPVFLIKLQKNAFAKQKYSKISTTKFVCQLNIYRKREE